MPSAAAVAQAGRSFGWPVTETRQMRQLPTVGSFGYQQSVGTSIPAARAASRIVAPGSKGIARPFTLRVGIGSIREEEEAPSILEVRPHASKRARGSEIDFSYCANRGIDDFVSALPSGEPVAPLIHRPEGGSILTTEAAWRRRQPGSQPRRARPRSR